MTSSAVGSPAPDFVLRDQQAAPVRSAELRGRPAIVVFFPYAFTGVRTRELRGFRDAFAGRDARVLGISCDSMCALRVFAESEGLDLPLLSDFWPHGAVARTYGVFDAERGCALRGTFVRDAHGVVRWTVRNAIADTRDVAACAHVVDGLVAA